MHQPVERESSVSKCTFKTAKMALPGRSGELIAYSRAGCSGMCRRDAESRLGFGVHANLRAYVLARLPFRSDRPGMYAGEHRQHMLGAEDAPGACRTGAERR